MEYEDSGEVLHVGRGRGGRGSSSNCSEFGRSKRVNVGWRLDPRKTELDVHISTQQVVDDVFAVTFAIEMTRGGRRWCLFFIVEREKLRHVSIAVQLRRRLVEEFVCSLPRPFKMVHDEFRSYALSSFDTVGGTIVKMSFFQYMFRGTHDE